MATETVTAPPREGDAPAVDTTAAPARRTVPSWALFAFVALGTAATVLIHNRWLFTQAIYAEGDFGLNGLLADQARHFTLWQGNYSRVGFHHPGPAGLYVMMVGDVVAHSWLHLVPAATNGMIVGQVVFDAALLGGVAIVVRRLTGSALGGITVAALVLMPVMTLKGTANPWPPYQYMPAFALFVVAAVAVAGGITRAATAYVLGAGLVAHGQVTFLLFVAVTTVVVAAGWWWAHRGEVRATLADCRRRLQGAAVLLGLFVLPLVLQTIFHGGGPWRAYAAYSAGSGAQHNGLRASVDWLGWYVTNSGVRISGAGAAVLACVVLAVTERDRVRRRQVVALLVVATVEALLVLVFALRGVDGLTEGNRYLVYFALVLAPAVVGLAATLLGVRVARLLGRLTGETVARVAVGGIAAVLIGAFLLWLVPDPRMQTPYRGVGAVGVVARTVDDAPARDGRKVSFELEGGTRGGLATFAYTAGLVFELKQRGVESCVWSSNARQQKQWLVQFTPPYTCDPSDLGGTWQVEVQNGTVTTPAPANKIYADRAVTYYPRPTTG